MSNYPTTVDDPSSLYAPADAFSSKPLTSKLAVSCQASDTTLQLADGVTAVGGPAAYGIVRIDDEQVLYAASSGGNLTGCTRGFNGTAKVGHAAQTVVRWPYVAAFDQALQAAVEAIQTAVGITGAFNFLAPADLFVGSAPNRSIKLDNGYIGGQAAALCCVGFNAWFDGAAWHIPDGASKSSVIVFVGTAIVFYLTQTAGMSDFLQLASYSLAGLQFTTGGTVNEIVTTVGSPGSDAKLATEKAVRTAIASIPVTDIASLKIGGAGPVTSIVTTVGSPGSDSNFATEKAVRTAIGAGAVTPTGAAIWPSANINLPSATFTQVDTSFDQTEWNDGFTGLTIPATGKYLICVQLNLNLTSLPSAKRFATLQVLDDLGNALAIVSNFLYTAISSPVLAVSKVVSLAAGRSIVVKCHPGTFASGSVAVLGDSYDTFITVRSM